VAWRQVYVFDYMAWKEEEANSEKSRKFSIGSLRDAKILD
jgi:hypothetical protein